MANLHNPSPMRVVEGQKRPWLADNYPASSAARNQDLSKGVIYKRPDSAPGDDEGGGSDGKPLYCIQEASGYRCSEVLVDVQNGLGDNYSQLPDGAVVVSRRADETT